MDKNDSVGCLLEHVKILTENISALDFSDGFSISTPENARTSLQTINELRNKVIQYKKTASTLRTALEAIY